MDTTPPHRRRPSRHGFAFESLESRLLLSADLAPIADILATEPSLLPAEHRSLEAFDPAPPISMRVDAHELVFVDGAIADRDALVADFVRATGADRPVEVVVLDPERDGIAQIGEALATRTGLTAVHILSHGRDGAIQLGSTMLDAATLDARAEAVSEWGRAFTTDGDLLLYGCDVADSIRGESFVGELARLTGADVAASTNLTGDAALGGDWTLEFASGAIETPIALPGALDASWHHTLAAYTADWDTQSVGTVAETAPGSSTYVSTFNVGAGTVTVTVSDPLDKLSPGPTVSNDPSGLTGGFATDQRLELNSSGYAPGESSTITIAFSGFGGTISNVRFMIFDIDTGDDGSGFVDQIVATANGGALNPTAVTTGPSASDAAGYTNSPTAIYSTGPAAIEGTNTYPYASFDGVNTVTGRYSGWDPISGDSNQEDNAPNDASNGNAYLVFGQNGITSVSFSYQNPRAASGQAIALHDIRFNVNDPPAIGGLGTLNYPENDPATVIAGGATVTDPDSADFDTGTLTVGFTANGTAADQLAIRNQGTGAGQIGVSGANVTYGGVTIGTFAGGANGASLVITFNANATPAAVEALARNIAFANTSDAPSTAARTVRFTVTDGDGGSASANATVNVAAVNDAPILAGANNLAGITEDPAANGGTAVSVLITGQVTDVDAGALAGIAVTTLDNTNGAWQYSIDGGTSWNAFGVPSAPTAAAARLLRDTDLVRFVPTADWNGTATLSFRAWDRTSGAVGGTADTTPNGGITAFSTAVRTSSIAVSPVGDTVNDAATINEDNAVTFNVLANDNFQNAGRALTAVAGAANGSVSFTAAGSVTYTPNANWNGTETLTYTVTSGGVTETGTLTITVAAVNDAPTLGLGANQTVAEDAPAQTVVGFAPAAPGGGPDEAGQTFTYTVTNDNNALFAVQPAIAANGTLTYTLAANAYGTANVTVTVTDSGGVLNGGVNTSGPGAFTITATPVADTPSVTNAATLEDVQTSSGLVISRNPVDSAEVTHYRITGIIGGTLFLNDGTTALANGAFITAAQGAAGLKFTPAANSVVNGSFNVQASTAANVGGLGGGVATATIAVTPVNDEPSFTIAGNQTVLEDAVAQTVAGFAGASPGGGPDEAGQTFTYTVTNDNNALFAVQPAVAANGTLTYTLTPNASGTATVTLCVTDSGGTLNGGDDTAPAQTFMITVTPVADAPALTVTPAAGNEDTVIALSIAPAMVDTDGSETLSFAVASIPVGATLSDAVFSFTAAPGNQTTAITGWNLATLTILPPLNSDVGFTLSVAATATEGANGSAATTNASLAVTVNAVADAPTLTVSPAAGNEDTAIALSITPALVDTDGSEALSLTVSSLSVGATLSDGVFSFTATLGNTMAVITGWNLAALTILPPLNSDADFTLVVAATATEGANGSAATTTANLAVTVNAVADAPGLTVNPAAGNEDTAIALSITPALVDTDGSEALSLAVASIPVGATLSDGINNFTATAGNTTVAITGWKLAALTILPPLNSDADFTLAVAATSTESANGSAATTNANLAVTVNAVADAPTLAVNPAAGNEDTAIALSIAPALVDTDGSETLSLTVSLIPVGAVINDGVSSFTATSGNTTATISGWNLGALTILPPLNSDVDFTLVVAATATEGANGSAATTTANLAVTVDAVADAPTLTVTPAAGNEDTAIALSIAPALVDTDGSEALSISVAAIPVGATLSDGVASFTATPGSTTAVIAGWNLAALTILPPLSSDADFTLSVAATATEGANGSAATTNADLAVTVNAVADAPTLTVNPAAGSEDTAIALSIAPALLDTDGSETLSLTVASIPVGATLSDGVFSFTASLGNATVNVTGWNLAALTILPPLNSDVDVTLSVAATATEGANGSTATTTANLAVTVDAVADAPTLTVSPAAGNEDTAIALSIAPALVDTDGSETLSISLAAVPVGATLSDSVNGFTATLGNTTADIGTWNLAALTILPPLNSDADFTLSVAATATEGANGSAATTTANLEVTVDAVADAPNLTVNPATGNEDSAIALSIAPALVDTDGSETLSLSVSAIPVGATLSDRVNSFTATVGNTAIAITDWDLATLTIQPPLNSDVDFTLSVAATATEGANGAAATTTANLDVTVDAVADAPTLVVNPAIGNEDTAIALSTAPALVDTDGSETLSLAISAIPVGATLSDGFNSFIATAGNTAVAVTGWNLAALTIQPPLNSDVDFVLTVAATATEGANGSTATTTANLDVAVDAVADAPTLAVNPATGNEDTPIPLSIARALVDTDGSEALSITVSSIPVGATLSDGVNGFTATAGNTTIAITGWNLAALTIQPPPNSDVDFVLTVAATATEGANGSAATTTANLAVAVDAVADAPTLAINPAAGNEDTAIPLAIAPALVDTDGSETLSLTVSAIPVGATVSDGVKSFTATAGNTAVAITGWNLTALTIQPPLNSDVDFTLTVAATATEGANGSTATTTTNLGVIVDAVADAPVVTVNPAVGNEDTAIALSIADALVDTDGSESLALSLSAIPVGAVLTDGVNTFAATAGNQAVSLAGWNLAPLTVTPPANADTDFTLTVSATSTEAANGDTATTTAALFVAVVPVNDAPTVAAPGVIDVVEDVASPLLGISFGDVDVPAGPVTATFTVAQGTLSATAGSGVTVGCTATAFTLTGTLADLNAFLAAGGLRYTTVLDGNAPVAFTASLNDLGNTGVGGPLSSPTANVTLDVIPVNDPPVLGNATLAVDSNGVVVLTGANLSATDVDDPTPSLVFIIGNLEHGRFELAGNPGVAVVTFTQGQVTSGQVKFVQTDPLFAPSYRVYVTDGVSTVGPGVVGLTFRPLADNPGKETREAATLPAVSFSSATLDSSRAGLVNPFPITFSRQPLVATDGGGEAIAEAEPPVAAGSRQTLAKLGDVWELRSRGAAYPELGFGQMDKLPTATSPLEFGIGPDRPHEEPRGLDLAMDAIRTAGLVVSIGAVWWAARAAGLVSSLLAITPTWRHIDPLPVLGRDDDEPVGGWEDPIGDDAAKEDASANEMFDGAAKKAPSG